MARHSTPLKKQSGFSLLEATASIVLLGTVAASALPRLAILQDQAESAVVQYANTSLSVASSLASLKQKLKQKADDAPVIIDDIEVNMLNGKPIKEDMPKLVETKGLVFDHQKNSFALMTVR